MGRTALEITQDSVQVEPTTVVAQIDADADTKRDFEMSLISASGEMLTDRFKKWAGANRTTLALAFTDVVGSTRLGQDLGDEEMFKVRAAHFSAARSAIKRQQGYEIKTIGDAFMVAFRTVIDALNFCLDVRKNSGHKSLSVRAGIHVGPVRIEDEDAFGNMGKISQPAWWGAIQGVEIWVSDRARADI